MRQFFLILIGVAILFFNTSNSIQKCDDFNGDLGASYEAIKKLEQIEFHFSDSFETDKIFGIKSAEFFSCDNETGYMVVRNGSSSKLYENIPVALWNQFKINSAVDNFYKSEIQNSERYTYR